VELVVLCLSLGLAEYGADVIVASRRLDHLEEVAEEIHALGRKTMAISVDITDEKSVADMVENILKRFPRVMQPTVLVSERWML